jgi:hypothetical protein
LSGLAALNCANCGAPIDSRSLHGLLAVCGHCGASFRVPSTQTPEPTLGDLLLGADFTDPDVPGWVVTQTTGLEFRPGSPAELWAALEPSDLIHPVLRTPGPFDDVDAAVTIRFISGAYDQLSAGFEVRSWDPGDYIVRISAQGTFSAGWHEKTEWGGELVPWSSHPALRAAWGDANRLRVVVRDATLRLFLNGVLATALSDDRFASGRVRLVISPGPQERAVVAFANLHLREPLAR